MKIVNNLISVFDVNWCLRQRYGADNSAAECHRYVVLFRVQRVLQGRFFHHVEQLRDEVLVVAGAANQKQTSTVSVYLRTIQTFYPARRPAERAIYCAAVLLLFFVFGRSPWSSIISGYTRRTRIFTNV